MKVLGVNNDKETVIAELSKSELANLLGFYSHYDIEFKQTFRIGAELNVSSLYKDNRELQELERKVRDWHNFFKDNLAIMTKHMKQVKALNEEGL